MKNSLLLFPLLLSSCAISLPPRLKPVPLPPVPEPTGERLYLKGEPEWDSASDASAAFGSDVSVNGDTVDLEGNTLDGSKLYHPDDPNDESAVGLVIRKKGLIIQNGTINDIPGGVIVKAANVKFKNIVFTKPGEDFVSTVGEGSTDLYIDGCDFHNTRDGDKSIQANCAIELEVRNTRVYGGITGARVQKTDYNQNDVRAYFIDTHFIGNETGINIAGDTTVTLSGCTFQCRRPWKISEGSGASVVIEDWERPPGGIRPPGGWRPEGGWRPDGGWIPERPPGGWINIFPIFEGDRGCNCRFRTN